MVNIKILTGPLEIEAVLGKESELFTDRDVFIIKEQSGRSVLATPHNRTPDGHYFDTAKGKVFTIKGEELQIEIPNVHPLTKALASELDCQYVQRRFPKGCAGAYDAQDGSPLIHFYIYSYQEDHRNNRYGRWIASWELDCETGKLKGKVHVGYTCREEINLHYSQELDYEAETEERENYEGIIAFILKHVAIAGDTVQSALIKQQETFYSDDFKRIRRPLPITRAKMDWYRIYYSIPNHWPDKVEIHQLSTGGRVEEFDLQGSVGPAFRPLRVFVGMSYGRVLPVGVHQQVALACEINPESLPRLQSQSLFVEAISLDGCQETGIRGKPATLCDSALLTGSDAVKPVIRFSLDISQTYPDWQYQPGDAFEVFADNDPFLVGEVLSRLGLDGKQWVKLSAVPSQLSFLQGLEVPLERLFLDRIDLTSYPKKAFLRGLAEYCQDTCEQRLLLYLSSRHGSAAYLDLAKEYAGIADFLATFPSCQPPLWLILQHSLPLAPRSYSVITSPLESPGKIEFICSIESFRTPEPDSRLRLGVCSRHLLGAHSHGQGNGRLHIAPRPSPHFRLPADSQHPIVMICAGAGVAPFIGFLRHRRALFARGRPLGEAVLFFGFRQKDQDFLFREELDGYLASDRTLSALFTATSREEPRGYVQDVVWEERTLILELMFTKDAVIFLCGDEMTMIKGVNDTLSKMLADRLGTAEKAMITLKEWNEHGRIVRDIWV